MTEFPIIPGYRIERELGQGGMADVYEAVQENLDRRVAIKVIIPELFRDPTFSDRFIKEAQTAAKLNHPNILHVYDVGKTEKSHYIVMECLNESLKDRIKQEGPLESREALAIVRQIGLALDYAHRKGFIHRDIKPDNILFREDGTPVLTDFGIAKTVDSTTKLTRTGMSVGTPHYMSPEQIRGFELDGRADIYSLGIVFYEMLIGKVPYDATDTIAICLKHVQDPIPVLPAELVQYQPLLDKILAKNPEERMQSGKNLVDLIDLLLGKASGISVSPVKKIPGRKDPALFRQVKKPLARKILIPTLLMILVVLVVILWIVLERQKPLKWEAAKASPAATATDKKPQAASSKTEPTTSSSAQKSSQTKIVATELPEISILDLDPQLVANYHELFQRLTIANTPEGVSVFGQIALQVRVESQGKVKITEFFPPELTVEPASETDRAIRILKNSIMDIKLPSPRDSMGNPCVLTSWRLNFKVVNWPGKWVLVKQ